MEEMLMQLLAQGGMPPGAPMPGGDPMAQAPVAGDPMAAMAGAVPPQYPSTDPAVLQEILGMLAGMRDEDHMALQQDQDGVLMQLMQMMGLIPGMPSPEDGFAEGAAPAPGPVV